MAKKTDVLNGWVATLAALGIDVPAQALEDYLKGRQIGPSQVTDDLLLEHAESIRQYAASPALPGTAQSGTPDFIGLIEGQSAQVQGLGQELRPWIQQKAEADAGAIADALTSYGPLVMTLVQQRIANDPFGAQIASFRQQIAAQLAGASADAPALPASSEG